MVFSPEAEELIAAPRREIAALSAEVSDLRRRLGLDSSHGSKPPSSDGAKRQPRHAGSPRTRSGKAGGVDKQQVFDLPVRPLVVTDHQASVDRCTQCRCVTKAAAYRNIRHLIPEDRNAQALSDLFGSPLVCPASIVAWVGKTARGLQRVYERNGERVAKAKVRHLDETRYRIVATLHGLHTTSSLAFTLYRTEDKRGTIVEGLDGGVVVHDHFTSCRRIDKLQHTFVKQYWAAVRLARAFHRQLPPAERSSKPRHRAKRRAGHNLLDRLKTFHAETLCFLTDFDVPFTNNLAEQDFKMMKVKMKISGSFRTIEGARVFATLGSIVSTARRQGANILQPPAALPHKVMQTIITQRRPRSYISSSEEIQSC